MNILKRIVLRFLPACMHHHSRQGALMRKMVQIACEMVGYEAEEPNTDPPVVTTADASSYRKDLLQAARRRTLLSTYHPLMGVYVTTDSDPADIVRGFQEGIIAFIKWYPPHGTTGSARSVPILSPAYCRVADVAERYGIPFQHHGELTHDDHGNEIDHQDREPRFYGLKFPEIRYRWPRMRYFGEHLTTEDGVSAVLADEGCCGTVTPWHLLEDRRIVNRDGMNPLYAIMPALKRERHVEALHAAVRKRCKRIFAGPDTAAHSIGNKSKPVGCACGIYSPWWIEWYAVAFERLGMLDYLEQFLCISGPEMYGLEPISGTLVLEKTDQPRYPEPLRFGRGKNDFVLPFGYATGPRAEELGLLKPLSWCAHREY